MQIIVINLIRFSGKPIITEVKTFNTGLARKVSIQSLLVPILIMGFYCKGWKKDYGQIKQGTDLLEG